MHLERHSAAVDIWAGLFDQDVWLRQSCCLVCDIMLGGVACRLLCMFSDQLNIQHIQPCAAIVCNTLSSTVL